MTEIITNQTKQAMENQNEELLIKDSRWDLWGINSIQFFEKVANSLTFKPIIAEDIVKRFEVIKRLVLFSYFEYDFLDIAFQNALMTFEMALKIRYKELTKKDPILKSLNDLIKWGTKEELFEDEEFIIDALRKLRNSLAHPQKYQLFGHLSLNGIQRIVEVINGLYDDISLRKLRREEKGKLESIFDQKLKEGAILEIQGKRLIIFKASLLHYINIVTPPIYHFLFWPIFDPKNNEEKITICDPIIIACFKWEKQDNNFCFLKTDGDKCKMTNIDKIENQTKYNDWKHDFELRSSLLSQLIEIHISELRTRYSKTD